MLECSSKLQIIYLEFFLLEYIYMEILSLAFKSSELIPGKYTCDGEDINPPLQIKNMPDGTKSLALIIDDPDAPRGVWTHWLVWNINPEIKEISENFVPNGAIQGTTSFRKVGYDGPCPPSGIHRYFFKVYALDIMLNLPFSADALQLETIMKGHILGNAELMGKYGR